MNSQIETWRVEAFNANVYHLAQQRGSRLASKVRNETFTGKAEFFDRIGLATAQDKVGRNTDTPNLDIDHSRRMVTSTTREWGTLVDRKDKVQNIHNPESEYSLAAENAMGRKMDQVIIAAAYTTARTSEDGSGTQTLGNAQKVASVAAGALDYANVQMLRKMKRVLDASEAVGQRYLVHSAAFLDYLLSHTEVTSSDYNTVKALAGGQLNSYLGFEFIHSEFVGANALAASYDDDTFKYDTTTGLYNAAGTVVGATDETVLAFIGDGLLLGKNPNNISRVEERSDKGYSMQVYTAMDFGATRMEEFKVVQGIYKTG